MDRSIPKSEKEKEKKNCTKIKTAKNEAAKHWAGVCSVLALRKALLPLQPVAENWHLSCQGRKCRLFIRRCREALCYALIQSCLENTYFKKAFSVLRKSATVKV